MQKGARIFQKIRPKTERPGTSNDGERDDHNNIRHITSVLLGKMVGYAPSSFANLVFADERIEVGLKRGKFNHPAWTNEKVGANEEDEKEGETHAVTVIPIRPSSPPSQHHHYSANISYSHYPPPIYPQRPSLNQQQNPPTTQPMLKHRPKHQPRNEFCSKKPVEFTPIPVSYADLLSYLLDNSVVAITPAKVH